MRIKVSFEGATREYTTSEVLFINSDPPLTVAEILLKIIENQPRIKKVSKFLFISVNNILVPRNYLLSDNDEVSLFFRAGGG